MRGRDLSCSPTGSRLESGAAGYAVAWKTGQTWKGIKTHLGYNQEAIDAECAALPRALESARRRNTTPERVTIFTDAQAAIRRMASDEPGPGQKYALGARKHIAALRRARPNIVIEVRWCPAHEEIAEKKWAEARKWAGGRTSKNKYKMSKSQRPDGTAAESTKRLAARFYQLKTGHARTGQYLHWAKVRPTAQCWWCPHPRQTREHLLKGCPRWRKQQKALWKEVWKETGKGRGRWKAHELFADPRCSQAVLDFLSSTDVGKTVPAVEVEGDAGSEASEWELRERAEREAERRAEGLDAEDEGEAGEEHRLFLPTPPFMASASAE